MERVEEGIDQSNVTPKRVEVENILEEEDRISALPDCLLLEILSRLPSTESAIVTGTLSKRWKYLWNWVPTLIFKRFSKGSLSNFISFVEKTLTQCHQSKLKKFAIDYNYDMQLGSQVVSWIHYAISRNVEELDLRIFCYDVDIWNESFYSNSCFTDLRLQGCKFNPTGVISWKRLKSLWIYQGNLNAELMENILLGSPLLETVVLEEIYGTWRLCITSKSIKKLELFDYWDPDDGEFDLQVNCWIHYAISCNVQELDLNFLMDMNLNPEYFITELKLNDDFSVNSCFTHMKLSCCIFNLKGVIEWKKLRSLYIGSGRLDEDLIENILSGSPLLETLVLNDCYGYKGLNITSKSVKKLVCSRYSDRGGEFELASAIEINAPNILSLTIQGHLQLLKLSLSNVSSLVEANLNISTVGLHDETTPVQEEILKALFQSLRHVKKLRIGDYYCEVVLEKYKEATLEKHKKDRDPEIIQMGSPENCNTGRSYVGLISEEAKQVTRVAELEQLKGKNKKN